MILPPHRKVRVPGKLMLLGEYAVLTGSRAMVSSVNRYATIQWSPRPKRPSLVLSSVAEACDNSKYKDHVVVDTRSFYRADGQKLGIGSSAAVAVGTSVFLRQQLDAFALENALDGHRKASNGIGSGVDLASVFHGGVIATSVQPSAVEQLTYFFEDLHLAVFYLEKSASTKSMVARCQLSEQWQSLTNEMTSVSSAGIDAYKSRQSDEFMQSVQEYGKLMRSLGKAANVPIYTTQMERLSQCVERHGGVSKPSGAGGGDVALVFSKNAESFDIIARETGLEKLSLQLETMGTHFVD